MLSTFLLVAWFGGMQPSPWPDSLEHMAGQMVMVGVPSTDLEAQSALLETVARGWVGGVVLFARNLEGGQDEQQAPTKIKTLTTALQNASPSTLLIAIDQEGGTVRRLRSGFGLPPPQRAEALGGLPAEETYAFSRDTARVLRDLGFNLNFAPVVDVAVNPDNEVIVQNGRAFSSDAQVVAEHAAEFVKGHQDLGVLTCLKHFPGHGSSTEDSHQSAVNITTTWSDDELVPYRTLLGQGIVDAVMTAHVFHERLDPRYPATLSEHVVDGLLRGQLHHRGVVFSDSMQMAAIAEHYGFKEAIRRAIVAGVDILLFTRNTARHPDIGRAATQAIVELVRERHIAASRVAQSYQRVRDLKSRIPTWHASR